MFMALDSRGDERLLIFSTYKGTKTGLGGRRHAERDLDLIGFCVQLRLSVFIVFLDLPGFEGDFFYFYFCVFPLDQAPLWDDFFFLVSLMTYDPRLVCHKLPILGRSFVVFGSLQDWSMR